MILFFALIHFHAFRNLVTHFPSYLFPSIIDDTHIIGLVLVVSQAFHHFFSQLDLVGLMVQPYKCVVWFLLGLPSRFSPPLGFCTLAKGIKVLGVPLGSFSFASFFF
jgi:hypothetical protein